jgi:hypothetical protein
MAKFGKQRKFVSSKCYMCVRGRTKARASMLVLARPGGRS